MAARKPDLAAMHPSIRPGSAGLCLLLFASFLLASRAGAVELPCGPESVVSTTATGVQPVRAGDVDGDGDLDLLSAGLNDKVAWHENSAGDGSVWVTHAIRPQDGSVGWSVHAADVDGDGDLDVLSSSSLDLAWSENVNGDGSTWTTHLVDTTTGHHHSVYAADADGDGDTDIVAPSHSEVAWYENDVGDGSSWTRRVVFTATPGEDHFHGASAGDVDGDGDQDILSISLENWVVSWHENTIGDGSAWTAHAIGVGSSRFVTVSDVDGDGDLDAVSSGGFVFWYENTAGDGSVWASHQIEITGSGQIFAISMEDLDADGDPDLLLADDQDDRIGWVENTVGDGSAWVEHEVSDSVDGPLSVIGADLDGDGDPDFVAGSSNDGKVIWFENRTIHRSALFPEPLPLAEIPGSPATISLADIDLNGTLDVVVGAWRWVVWYQNVDGDGSTWVQRTIANFSNLDPRQVSAADLDGDGDPDVIGALAQTDAIVWWENLAGDGTSWNAHFIATGLNRPESVQASDLDRDGDLDVVSASWIAGKVAWHENTAGNGTAWQQHTIDAAYPMAVQVLAADLDRDGDPDVVASAGGQAIRWYENVDGSGTAWVMRPLDTASYNSRRLSAADVDGDGDLDVVFAYGAAYLGWYENHGTVWIRRQIPSALTSPEAVFTADLDGDGDTDVLAASTSENKVYWYENLDHQGTAWREEQISATVYGPLDVASGDLDRDGDPDVVTAATYSDLVDWYSNRGGQFALETVNTAPPSLEEGQTDDLLRIIFEHRGRAGDTDAELVSFDFLFEESVGEPLTTQAVNSLLHALHVYRDDGTEQFEPEGDTLVLSLETLSLESGRQTVVFPDGDLSCRVHHGTPATYFVVAEMALDAGEAGVETILVTHVTESSSTAEDRDHDIPLTLEFVPDSSSSQVIVPEVIPVSAGEVPDGSPYSETPLTMGKLPAGDLVLSFAASCLASDGDYAIYEGLVGDFASHVPLTCSTGGATSMVITPASADRYYLVVPQSANREGSYGRDSASVERLHGASACRARSPGQCPPVVPENDFCADAIPITPGTTIRGTTVNASGPDLDLMSGCTITAPGVWYSVSGSGHTMTAATCDAANFDTKISIFCRGCDPQEVTSVNCNDDTPWCAAFTSEVAWCTEDGNEYLILVHGFMQETGNFFLTLTDDGESCQAGVDCSIPRSAPR